jgi:hypothetical protein
MTVETGLLIAYGALLVGALIPIYIGSFASLKAKVHTYRLYNPLLMNL